MPEPIVGIDLGTTFSLVAIAEWPADAPAGERGPRVLPDERGRALCPSVVRLAPGAAPVVGWDAREAAAENPRNTIASVKRLMGRGVRDAAGDIAGLSYRVVEGPGDTARVALPDGSTVSPQEVSAHILAHLKRQAERALGVPIGKAVVTVPAYFDDAQRQATRDAGRLAGLDVVRIVNEPTAAALAYGLGLRGADRAAAGERLVVIYDLGGGTFDVSILRLTPGESGPDAFQVLATSGDTRLGGDDIDRLVMDTLCPDKAGLSPGDLRALRTAAEEAKIALSATERTKVSLKLSTGLIEREITLGELEAMITPLVERSIDCCKRSMRDARRQLAGAPLDAVVLVGGSTRIPLVRRMVAQHFGLEPYTALDPDKVVALGAAVQGSILAGARGDAVLLDVIPLSLGIETVGGAVAKIIMRNSPVPARAGEMFSTSVDNQSGIELAVYQGEREMAADCRLLARFKLSGLPPMPAGIPQLRVTFDVDASGVLNVSAVEQRSGKRASLQVIPNHGLTRAEVERIEAESFAHARQDMARHRIVDLIANARLDLHWIKPRADALAARIEPDALTRLRTAAETLEAFVKKAEADWASVNPDEFHRAKEALDRASMPVHEASILESLRRDSAKS